MSCCRKRIRKVYSGNPSNFKSNNIININTNKCPACNGSLYIRKKIGSNCYMKCRSCNYTFTSTCSS